MKFGISGELTQKGFDIKQTEIWKKFKSYPQGQGQLSNHDNTGQGQAPSGRKLLGLIEIPLIEGSGSDRPKLSITKTKSMKFLDMIKTLHSDIRNRDLGTELDDVIKNGGSRAYEMQNPWEKAGVFNEVMKVSVNLSHNSSPHILIRGTQVIFSHHCMELNWTCHRCSTKNRSHI